MAVRKIVILANSWKNHGRCLAGLGVDSGEWIRPISSSASGELDDHQTLIRDDEVFRQLRPFDVVTMELGAPRPTSYHPEDVIVRSKRATLVGPVSVERFLERFGSQVEVGPAILGTTSRRIKVEDIDPSTHRSLTIVRVADPIFYEQEGRVRARIVTSGRSYDLSVTDVEFCESWLQHRPEIHDALLTISLAVPWIAPDGVSSCYKLVAGVIILGY